MQAKITEKRRKSQYLCNIVGLYRKFPKMSLDLLFPSSTISGMRKLPVQALREFLRTHKALEEFSTQKGFGDLIGKSDVYVRGLERDPAKMLPRNAKLISVRTGVSADWLLNPEPDTEDEIIPAAEGGPLTHDAVIACVKKQIAHIDKRAEAAEAAASSLLSGKAGNKSIGVEKIVDTLMVELKEAILADIRSGNGDLFRSFMMLLPAARVDTESTADQK